jgi:hypothetical protein
MKLSAIFTSVINDERSNEASDGTPARTSARRNPDDRRPRGGHMTKLYIPVLVVHVLVAVLGLGSVASIAIVAGTARRAYGMCAIIAVIAVLMEAKPF